MLTDGSAQYARGDMMNQDYYQLLGVPKDADAKTIKKAYRQLAMRYHPDVNKEAGSEDQFKKINEAYEVLSDPEKKALYDQYGTIDPNEIAARQSAQNPFHQSQSFDFDDLFGSQSGAYGGFGGFSGFDDFNFSHGQSFRTGSRRSQGPTKGQDIQAQMAVSFMEAAKGETKTITIEVEEPCSKCDGTGSEDGQSHTCPNCQGTGTVFGQSNGFGYSQQACQHCHGTGEVHDQDCPTCHGQGYIKRQVTLEVKIPKGIPNGKKIKLSGKGERGYNGGSNGDLIIQVQILPDATFTREDNNITTSIQIPYLDAVLGTTTEVPTLDGVVDLKIPAGIQPGQKLRLKGRGITWQGKTGDEYVLVKVNLPKNVNEQDKALYEQIRQMKD